MTWTGFGTISAIEIVIFVLVIGEEVGWRGFLQPRLRARMGRARERPRDRDRVGPLAPADLPAAGFVARRDFLVFAWWVIPLAVVMGFVAERARYSVIVATVMQGRRTSRRGAANISLPIVLPGVDREAVMLVTGAIYAAGRGRAGRPLGGHTGPSKAPQSPRRLRTYVAV